MNPDVLKECREGLDRAVAGFHDRRTFGLKFGTKGQKRASIRVSPDWLDGFYCDVRFPSGDNFVRMSREENAPLEIGTTRYQLNANDPWAGEVRFEDEFGAKHVLRWCGYASRHYDGQLGLYLWPRANEEPSWILCRKLSPLKYRADAQTAEENGDDLVFAFEGIQPVRLADGLPLWPGFLCLYTL